jgi:hypothetical protein
VRVGEKSLEERDGVVTPKRRRRRMSKKEGDRGKEGVTYKSKYDPRNQ